MKLVLENETDAEYILFIGGNNRYYICVDLMTKFKKSIYFGLLFLRSESPRKITCPRKPLETKIDSIPAYRCVSRQITLYINCQDQKYNYLFIDNISLV